MKLLALALLSIVTTGMVFPDARAETAETSAVFTLPELPYATNALAPVIDAKTMETHHGKHHKAYVDNLNKEVEKDARLKGKDLEAIMSNVSKYSMAVRNNAGGHWNHSFFWPLMARGGNGAVSSELQTAINQTFGSMDEFKTKFQEAGAAQFGSGWVWLVVNRNGKLEIASTPNQDNPLMNDAKVKGTPILGNDVWEHAYYLSYQNRRADYLSKWWDVVDWSKVSKHYAVATKK